MAQGTWVRLVVAIRDPNKAELQLTCGLLESLWRFRTKKLLTKSRYFWPLLIVRDMSMSNLMPPTDNRT